MIGAGWIGAEVAASARQAGLTWRSSSTSGVPLERVLGREMGCFFGELHRDHGVAAPHRRQTVEALEGDGARRARAPRRRRELLDCDFVVVGIGVAPRVELAEAAGLEVQNGILVDERLETCAAGRVRGGRRRERDPPVLRDPRARRALGQRSAPARDRRARRCSASRRRRIGCRTSSATSTTLGMEYTGLRLARRDEVVLPRRAGGARVHRLLAGGGSRRSRG